MTADTAAVEKLLAEATWAESGELPPVKVIRAQCALAELAPDLAAEILRLAAENSTLREHLRHRADAIAAEPRP